MTDAPISMDKVEPTKPPRSQWADIWDQFKSHRGAMWGAGIFLFIILMVIAGPWVYWNRTCFPGTSRYPPDLRGALGQ